MEGLTKAVVTTKDRSREALSSVFRRLSKTKTPSSADQDYHSDDDPGCANPEYTLDPHWINIGEIQLWLDTCDRKHGPRCHTFVSRPKSRPLWLVDVVMECIVPAKKHRYAALSYVWGGVDAAQTTKANIDFLQSPGSMSENSSTLRVSPTIRHAMGLVRLLGEKYLWVDRFCICQDDAASKHSQLQCMADIYSNAYLTIVAANGWDADHGLRGIKDVTEPRELSPHLDFDVYKEYMNPNNSIWVRLHPSRCFFRCMLKPRQFSRGWTFQELLFSRRKLFFQQQMVKWECQCSVWHESTGIRGQIPGRPSPDKRIEEKCVFRPDWQIRDAELVRDPWGTYETSLRLYVSATSRLFGTAFLTEDALEYTESHLPRRWPFGLPWGTTSPHPRLPARILLGAPDF